MTPKYFSLEETYYNILSSTNFEGEFRSDLRYLIVKVLRQSKHQLNVYILKWSLWLNVFANIINILTINCLFVNCFKWTHITIFVRNINHPPPVITMKLYHMFLLLFNFPTTSFYIFHVGWDASKNYPS